MTVNPDDLIHQYMGLSQSIAQQVWRTAPHALELDELRGIAYLGLVAAGRRWLPYCQEKGYSPEAVEYFKPFAVLRIRGALMDAIRAADWATRSLRNRAKALQEAGQDKGIPEKELAERTGMTVKEVRGTVRGMSQRPVSLDAEELDPEADSTVESSAFARNILDTVAAHIRGLDGEQQIVLALHYYAGLQLQDVARTMGISESRASQLHARAVLAVHACMVHTAKQKDDEE